MSVFLVQSDMHLSNCKIIKIFPVKSVYIHKIFCCRFFVVEDHILSTTQGLVNRAYMDELWEMSVAKLAASLRTSAVSIIIPRGGGVNRAYMDKLWEMSAAKLAASLRTSAVSIIIPRGGGVNRVYMDKLWEMSAAKLAASLRTSAVSIIIPRGGGGGGSTGRTWTNCGKCLRPS